MGIFSKRIEAHYASVTPQASMPLAVASPWTPTDALTQWTFDQLLADAATQADVPMTRDVALRIPGVKRAHGLHVRQFAGNPFRLMDDATPDPSQPFWLINSRSGVSPYHRMVGLGSDLFFNGWGCLSFDRDPREADADCLHVPFGAWGIDPDTKEVWINTSIVPAAYAAYPVAISAGYGENGLLTDGLDTLREARKIEAAYMERLNNPVPLTTLGLPRDVMESWTNEEIEQYRSNYVRNRAGANGAVAVTITDAPVTFPALQSVDLFESGRNAVRLDIANHTATPASLLEGVSQGGSGTSSIKYTGVANGATRNELWDFGLAKAFTTAFETRMSLDDICAPGKSIRADLTNMFAVPEPTTNPTSED